jgi:hypothetical protein
MKYINISNDNISTKNIVQTTICLLLLLVLNANAQYNQNYSTDPGWITSNAADYSWDSVNKMYNIRGTPQGSYTGVGVHVSGSFSFAFDWYLESADYVCYLAVGLYGERTKADTNRVEFFFGHDDSGREAGLTVANKTGGGFSDYQNKYYELNVWYRVVVSYDVSLQRVTAELRRLSDNALVQSYVVNGVGDLGLLPYFGARSTGGYASGTAIGKIDNVAVEVSTKYQTDFTFDPGWTTSNAQDYSWDSVNKAYRIRGTPQGSCAGVNVPVGTNFSFAFDWYLERADYVCYLAVGLYGERTKADTNRVEFFFGHDDSGREAGLTIANKTGSGFSDYQNKYYELDVWYRVTVNYDASLQRVTAELRRLSDNALVQSYAVNGVGDLGLLPYFGARSTGGYASGTATGKIDNVLYSVIGQQAYMTINVKTVQVTLHVTPTKRYQLLSSFDLITWTNVGVPFVATLSESVQEFNVMETGRYFQLKEIQ